MSSTFEVSVPMARGEDGAERIYERGAERIYERIEERSEESSKDIEIEESSEDIEIEESREDIEESREEDGSEVSARSSEGRGEERSEYGSEDDARSDRSAECSGSATTAERPSFEVEEEEVLFRLNDLLDNMRAAESFDDEDQTLVRSEIKRYEPKARRARQVYDQQKRHANEIEWMRQALQERAAILDACQLDFEGEFAALARRLLRKHKRMESAYEQLRNPPA